jgi:PAS domain S-box-containing protein
MVSDEYRAVFQAAPDGILVVDHRGIIRSANPMACRMFGYALDELVGQNVDALVPHAARAAHPAYRSRYVSSPRARPMGAELDLSGRRKDGSEFPAEISLSPWESAEGMRIIVIVRDITQRMRLRDFCAGALRASEDERRRIARELHDDTAQHLAALLMWVRLIEPKVEAEEAREKLRELRNEIAACAEGVRRIARGLRPPELEDAGIVAALRAHARSMRELSGFNAPRLTMTNSIGRSRKWVNVGTPSERARSSCGVKAPTANASRVNRRSRMKYTRVTVLPSTNSNANK